ncbi:D-aspartate oxidase-like isoform X2 [Tachypleus tridentatus]|uniref:D-aspartate oxidase-like isoform X2 n=1 Tax=Tachypleus tridentatus TaxID=6853 RepID=UPI003FCFCC4E
MLKIVDLQMASLKGPYPKVVVIGAGVIGLSTALCIQEIIPGVVLTVIADKFENDTLSSGAGGLFRPDNNIGPSSEIFKEWCRDSYNHFMSILKTPDASEAGIQQLSGYHFSSVKQEHVQNEVLEELVPLLRPVTEEEHKLFPPELKAGMFYTTTVTDCYHYLPWLRKRIESNGGYIKSKNIQSLEEVAGQFDVVVNCTGLGSKTLLGDKFLIPVRGQVIKVSAPWIKHFYYADDTYIIPGFNYVTLGGTKELGNWKTELSSHDRQSIWERCTRLVPSLEKSKVLWEWVGLRPFRQPVRVEKEIRNLNSGKQKVVHNYGHGAHGVSLSWGTAKHAARLVKEILDDPLDFTTYSRL